MKYNGSFTIYKFIEWSENRRFRGEWDKGKFYVVVVHWRYRNEAKRLMHVQSCYCCCCLLSKRSALSENEGTKWGHNFTSTRDATSIFCGHQSLAKEVPSLLSYSRALRVLAQSPGSNLRPPALKSKFFLAFAVVVTWSPNLSAHRRIILMKGPFWIRTGLCSIWFHDKCMLFSLCFFTQYTPPDYLPKVYEDLPMSPTHREAVINAFVYVHQTLHQANERLAKRGGRVMAITPRHYLDFINHYVSMPGEFYTIC